MSPSIKTGHVLALALWLGFSVGVAGADAPGRFRPARGSAAAAGSTPEQSLEIERLQALGYLAGVNAAPDLSGVVRHDASRSFEGLNLYASGHAPEAILMDMGGQILHRWSFSFAEAFPEHAIPEKRNDGFWRRVHLRSDGSLLAIFEGLGIVAIDRDSNLLWANDVGAHHDLEVTPDGRIHLLTRVAHLLPRINERTPVLEDFISVLSSEGEELSRVSLLASLEASPHRESWDRRRRRKGDLFHTNTLVLLDGQLAARVPGFGAGRYLVSLLHLDAIGVVDPAAQRFTWWLEGDFDGQHDPKVLESGRLLLFDNHGLGEASRVLEIDPATGELMWQYQGSQADPFFSGSCGTAERLPNGNTLITESDNGRAFEVTRDGAIVWEYLSPFRAGEHGELIATVMEMVRLPADHPLDWLSPPPAQP